MTSRHSLIVGINAYSAPNQLLGQVNNAIDLKGTLIPKRFSNILLLDSQATRANIINQLNVTIGCADPGDSIVFAFFGHGSWFNGSYGRSECICPVDYATNGFIADYELAAMFSKVKSGVSFDVVLGCCYSGDGTTMELIKKYTNTDIKNMKQLCIPGPLRDNRKSTNVIDRIEVDNIVPKSNMNHVLWAACGRYETAYEAVFSGKPQGIFPVYLCYYLRNRPNDTRTQIDALTATQVTKIISSQHPQTEGTVAELTQLPFT